MLERRIHHFMSSNRLGHLENFNQNTNERITKSSCRPTQLTQISHACPDSCYEQDEPLLILRATMEVCHENEIHVAAIHVYGLIEDVVVDVTAFFNGPFLFRSENVLGEHTRYGTPELKLCCSQSGSLSQQSRAC